MTCMETPGNPTPRPHRLDLVGELNYPTAVMSSRQLHHARLACEVEADRDGDNEGIRLPVQQQRAVLPLAHGCLCRLVQKRNGPQDADVRHPSLFVDNGLEYDDARHRRLLGEGRVIRIHPTQEFRRADGTPDADRPSRFGWRRRRRWRGRRREWRRGRAQPTDHAARNATRHAARDARADIVPRRARRLRRDGGRCLDRRGIRGSAGG